MKNLKSKKFAERSAWMVIYIILLNGRDIQSMYLRFFFITLNYFHFRASNTWEPEENIYAKDKIEDFEAKFRQLPKATEKRKRKPVKESQVDPDFDFDDIPIGKIFNIFLMILYFC